MTVLIEQRDKPGSFLSNLGRGWYGGTTEYDEAQYHRWVVLYRDTFDFRMFKDGVLIADSSGDGEVATRPTKPVFYVAHPVSGDPIGNCMKVVRWIKWFTEHDPSRVYVAPWVAEVLAFPVASLEVYERALQGDEDVIAHLDGLVMVGGKVSDGMRREWVHAMKNEKYGVDMSRFATPEDVPEDFELEPAE